MKGSTGINTGTINYVKKKRTRKSRFCCCKKCKYARVVDNIANCTLTGEIAVNKKVCQHYFKSKCIDK